MDWGDILISVQIAAFLYDRLPGDDNRLTVGSGNTVYQIEYIT